VFSIVFFFQAEDGIRDDLVTGVQTCALPICGSGSGRKVTTPSRAATYLAMSRTSSATARRCGQGWAIGRARSCASQRWAAPPWRSEERRVGEGWDVRGGGDYWKATWRRGRGG